MGSKHGIAELFVDEFILVVNKPSGLATIPEMGNPGMNLVNLLEPAYGKLWIVHRLDKETSGVLILARDVDTHKALNTQFEERDVAKTYHALVSGHPTWNERTISAPLLIDADRNHRTLVNIDTGKPATTAFRVLERFGRGSHKYALIEASPETGRTHQIRVHLMTLGSPVVMDTLYGAGQPILLSELKRDYRGELESERPLLARLGLHALKLTVRHPATGQVLLLEAPYPKDFGATINQLRRHAAA